ncbi:HlyD family secretion protein [Rhizobium leucaenae]|uniref:Membrane fusion protein (Multidrug efflux system) n=1 Tax=Rhizobium leucaenae TaxID=29450 RepID=A0A7W6ZQJ0_9HYPH|nr:HlyD family secretion protein [Rhizobium leucaenae]MBB4566705.1 membrane fusion protein (multidrug efflux system) [Rhizobium leucaenae]MBB6301400.1 membrane fusion protein (multidrug efflux system) [Rhizobium leucaenae]
MVELPRKEQFQTLLEADVKTPAVAEAPATGTPAAETRKAKSGGKIAKRMIVATALLAGAAFAGDYGYHYWTTGRFIESTDDAYVKADYTTIAPKISGYIAEVLVNDNDHVKAGQVLARIDDRDYRSALTQAQADVKASEAAITNLDAQIALQQSVIDQAKATIVASQASLTFAEADSQRSQNLIRNGAGTTQRAEQSQSARDQAAANLQRDQAALVAEQKKIAVLQTQHDQAVAQRDRSAAAAHQAELNLSYTEIVAPVDGTVGARTLRVGQFVTAGTQLMAVVPLNAVYVVANFKETQLTNVRPGQPVEIKVDSFPDAAIKGHVNSVSPASGLEFSLLPPDNATGNFTKIVQRIPVKITLDDASLAGLLRSGMSVEPEIDTKAAVEGQH